jgi:hypothetical protein
MWQLVIHTRQFSDCHLSDIQLQDSFHLSRQTRVFRLFNESTRKCHLSDIQDSFHLSLVKTDKSFPIIQWIHRKMSLVRQTRQFPLVTCQDRQSLVKTDKSFPIVQWIHKKMQQSEVHKLSSSAFLFESKISFLLLHKISFLLLHGIMSPWNLGPIHFEKDGSLFSQLKILRSKTILWKTCKVATEGLSDQINPRNPQHSPWS